MSPQEAWEFLKYYLPDYTNESEEGKQVNAAMEILDSYLHE